MKFQQSTKSHHPGLWQAAEQNANSIPHDPQVNQPAAQYAEVISACTEHQGEQWITIVGGSREFIAELLAAGIPKQRIRWLRTGNHAQREWALEQATLAGTSSVIVGWLNGLEQRFCQRIKMACRLSQTKSFLFEEDTLFPHLH